MAMRINWFGPTCLRAHCRIHDIRAVLDENELWGKAEMESSALVADPHTAVALECDLANAPAVWDILDEYDEKVGQIEAAAFALVSQYNYHVGPTNDPLYVV